MARKIRLTLFARLLLVLLILVPASWFTAAYINDEDPIISLRRWMGWDTPSVVMEHPSDPSPIATTSQNSLLISAKIDSLSQVNDSLRQAIVQLQEELRFQNRLTQQLRIENDSLKKRIWTLENQ